jgi:hypothetical protein
MPYQLVQMNPQDMADIKVKAGDLVEIHNDNGSTQAMVYPTSTAKKKRRSCCSLVQMAAKQCRLLVDPLGRTWFVHFVPIALGRAAEVTRHPCVSGMSFTVRPGGGAHLFEFGLWTDLLME